MRKVGHKVAVEADVPEKVERHQQVVDRLEAARLQPTAVDELGGQLERRAHLRDRLPVEAVLPVEARLPLDSEAPLGEAREYLGEDGEHDRARLEVLERAARLARLGREPREKLVLAD